MDVTARLLLLLDSRSPAGAHSHSGGMEAAIIAGFVDDLASVQLFCASRLQTAGRVNAAFAAAASRAWISAASAETWLVLDQELTARIPSPAQRAASRALGGGLRRLVMATTPDADLHTPWRLVPKPHQPIVLGAGCALAGGSPLMAARAAAMGVCTAPASAAVRLLGFDPYAIHTITAELSDAIEVVAAESAALSVEPLDQAYLSAFPSHSAPALDLLADGHAREEMRLFAS